MCKICHQHPQQEAIDHDLHAGIDTAILAVRYRVRKAFLESHAEHMAQESPAAKGLKRMDTSNDLNRDSLGSEPHTGTEIIARTPTLTVLHKYSPRDLSDEAEGCLCYWCRMSGYQRLLQAWTEANTQEKESFAVRTREFDVPF